MANPVFAKALEAFGQPVVKSIGGKIQEEQQINSMRSAVKNMFQDLEKEELDLSTPIPIPTGVGADGVQMGTFDISQTPEGKTRLTEIQKRKDWLLNMPLTKALLGDEKLDATQIETLSKLKPPVSKAPKWVFVSGMEGNLESTYAIQEGNPNNRVLIMQGNKLTSAGSGFVQDITKDIIKDALSKTEKDVARAFGTEGASMMELLYSTAQMGREDATKFLSNAIQEKYKEKSTEEKTALVERLVDFRKSTLEKNLRVSASAYKDLSVYQHLPDAWKKETRVNFGNAEDIIPASE